MPLEMFSLMPQLCSHVTAADLRISRVDLIHSPAGGFPWKCTIVKLEQELYLSNMCRDKNHFFFSAVFSIGVKLSQIKAHIKMFVGKCSWKNLFQQAFTGFFPHRLSVDYIISNAVGCPI